MSNQNDYLIELDDLVVFLNEEYKKNTGLEEDIGTLRLYLTIYFLYACYGSSYGRLPVSIESIQYPKYLTNVEFQSGSYGVAVEKARNILKNKVNHNNNKFSKEKINVELEAIRYDLMLYLTELTKSINEISDFVLVERVHEDDEWFVSYHNNRDVIDNEKLIDEYYKKYVN